MGVGAPRWALRQGPKSYGTQQGRILRNARKLHSIGERECKRCEYSQLTEEQQEALDKQSEACMASIRRVVLDYKTEARLENNSSKKVAIYFQGDPRGCPVHIAFKSQTWIGG